MTIGPKDKGPSEKAQELEPGVPKTLNKKHHRAGATLLPLAGIPRMPDGQKKKTLVKPTTRTHPPLHSL